MATRADGTPAPVCSGVPTVVDDEINASRTWSLVRSGFASSKSADSAATAAADCDVPVPLNRTSSTYPSGCSVSAYEPGARRLWMLVPGTATSGLRRPSPIEL